MKKEKKSAKAEVKKVYAPINEYVMVRKLEVKETDHGILLPDSNPLAEYHEGHIVAVPPLLGEKKAAYEKIVVVGARVLYKHFRNINYNGLECIKLEDIVFVEA